MFFVNLKNYEEFKERFVREDGSRKNKVLLSMYKDAVFMHAEATHPSPHSPINATDMSSLHQLVLAMTKADTFQEATKRLENGDLDCRMLDGLNLCNNKFFCDKYRTDGLDGLCEDGDIRCVRVIKEDGSVVKVKAGRLMRSVLDFGPSTSKLPEAVKNWFCEEFASQWNAYASANIHSDLTLHVDDAFDQIYGKRAMSMESCMSKKPMYVFYNKAVKAKAAYLTDKFDKIVARCVIFSDVKTTNHGTLRLAERQYSFGCDDALKRVLVVRLIEGGHIDGYKRVGAGCHSPNEFVLNNGEALPDDMYIKCDMKEVPLKLCPYMDSFKWYHDGILTNYDDENAEYVLEDTCGGPFYTGGLEYAESRDECYVTSEIVYCDNTGKYEYIGDTVELHNGRHAYYGLNCEGYDGVGKCDVCGKYYLVDRAYTSFFDNKTMFCSTNCRAKWEEENAEKYGCVKIYQPLTDSYSFAKKDEVFEANVFVEGEWRKCIVDNLFQSDVFVYNGEPYIDVFRDSKLAKIVWKNWSSMFLKHDKCY